MAKLTLETIKQSADTFELVRVVSVGAYNKSEDRETINANSRMIAAMVNLGRACKWFTENNRGLRNGQDRRYLDSGTTLDCFN